MGVRVWECVRVRACACVTAGALERLVVQEAFQLLPVTTPASIRVSIRLSESAAQSLAWRVRHSH